MSVRTTLTEHDLADDAAGTRVPSALDGGSSASDGGHGASLPLGALPAEAVRSTTEVVLPGVPLGPPEPARLAGSPKLSRPAMPTAADAPDVPATRVSKRTGRWAMREARRQRQLLAAICTLVVVALLVATVVILTVASNRPSGSGTVGAVGVVGPSGAPWLSDVSTGGVVVASAPLPAPPPAVQPPAIDVVNHHIPTADGATVPRGGTN